MAERQGIEPSYVACPVAYSVDSARRDPAERKVMVKREKALVGAGDENRTHVCSLSRRV